MVAKKMDIRYLSRYKFFDQDKLYQKETCDVRTQYSTLFPLSSNQNCPSKSYPIGNRSFHRGEARQTVPAHLPEVRQKGLQHPQLDSTQDTRLELCYSQDLDYLPLPQAVLLPLPRHLYRGSGVVSSVSESNYPHGLLHLSTMPVNDRIASSSTSWYRLENSQKHRQILSGARLRATRLKGPDHLSRRRDLHPKGP